MAWPKETAWRIACSEHSPRPTALQNSLENGHQMFIYGDCFVSRKHAISGATAPNAKQVASVWPKLSRHGSFAMAGSAFMPLTRWAGGAPGLLRSRMLTRVNVFMAPPESCRACSSRSEAPESANRTGAAHANIRAAPRENERLDGRPHRGRAAVASAGGNGASRR